jgi:hypothetical protein
VFSFRYELNDDTTGWKRVDKVGFFLPSISVFTSQYHSTNAPYSFSPTCWSYQKDKRVMPGNLPERDVRAEIGENWTEKNLTSRDV